MTLRRDNLHFTVYDSSQLIGPDVNSDEDDNHKSLRRGPDHSQLASTSREAGFRPNPRLMCSCYWLANKAWVGVDINDRLHRVKVEVVNRAGNLQLFA